MTYITFEGLLVFKDFILENVTDLSFEQFTKYCYLKCVMYLIETTTELT